MQKHAFSLMHEMHHSLPFSELMGTILPARSDYVQSQRKLCAVAQQQSLDVKMFVETLQS